MSTLRAIVIACAIGWPAWALTARAQQAPPVFRSSVDSVSVDVSVRKGDAPVTGLSAADFTLTDNGVPQTIDAIALSAVPIDVTLFLDTSGSMSGLLDRLKADVRAIAGLLRAGDRVRLLMFGYQIEDVFGWQPAGGKMSLETVGVGRISSVYDALVLALLRRPDVDRRHLVIGITDGVDTGSLADAVTVRDLARRAEAVLHLVVLNSEEAAHPNAPRAWWSLYPGAGDLRLLMDAAALTGGQSHSAAFRDPVVGAFRQAFDDFRLSYVLRYTPAGVVRGGWHDLRVDVPGKGYKIRARQGYFGG